MASLSPKDRVSLCTFTFSDGRRCRTPRTAKNPRFCFDHAQKEAQARAAQELSKDLDYFFSGDYLSACDLSTALSRLIPAVLRGDVKPKTARTVAYLAQTLLQSIRLSKHEYINAFGAEGWRQSVRNSVNGNHDYLFPPDSEQPESSQPQPQPVHAPTSAPQDQPQQSVLVVHPLTGEASSSAPSPRAQQPTSAPSRPQPAHPTTVIPNPVVSFANGGEGSASSPSPAPSPTSTSAAQTPASQATPTTQSTLPIVPVAQPTCPEQGQREDPPRPASPSPQPAPAWPTRDLHFDHTYHLSIDGKPF